jgi:ketosteroid isomerase-like protein
MKNTIAIPNTKDTSQADSSRSLLIRHLSAFQDNNLEAVISDYTDESVLITPDAVYKGTGDIRTFFEALIAQFPKHQSSFELDKLVVDDDLVYIIWHGKTPVLDIPFATDTFIIKNGKIHQQTFAGQLEPA